jgi:hypothetical protein
MGVESGVYVELICLAQVNDGLGKCGGFRDYLRKILFRRVSRICYPLISISPIVWCDTPLTIDFRLYSFAMTLIIRWIDR